MFHNEYIRLKNLKEKLVSQFDEEEKVINQEISIRNIFVYPLFNKESFGESKNHSNKYQPYGALSRLIDHVESLAIMTNEYHKKYYCVKNEEGQYSIKQDCLNKITRILLNEFSLYTAKPLTMNGYYLRLMYEKDFNENAKENAKKLREPIFVKMDNGDFTLWGDKSGKGAWQETKLTNFKLPEEWKNNELVFVSPIDDKDNFNTLNEGHTPVNEFAVLMEAIQQIATNQEQNVHLLLSSLSVLTNDNKLLNLSLYVQCGKEPKIETFCKGSLSKIDVTYNHPSVFSQENKPNNSAEARAMSEKLINISEYIASDNGKIISSNTVFNVKTAGGAEYLQAIDICLDVAFKHSKALLKKRVNIIDENYTSTFPKQANQISSSNCIEVLETEKITDDNFVHIDPQIDKAIPMNDDIMTVSDLLKAKKNKYPKMSIDKYDDGFVICKPSFGSSYKVVATEERKLGGYSSDLKESIDNWNNKAKKHIIDSKFEQVTKGKEYNMPMNPVTNPNNQIILIS